MKTSSRSLFHLIQALSKEERNYILRTAIHYRKGGKNILVQLFKAMEQLNPEEYDEEKLRKRIPNLSVRKNELYETILRSLADREERNLAVVMLGKLRWAAMLHYRKLFPETLTILNEIEEWAKMENQPYLHGVILQYKTFFVNSGLYKNHNINFDTIGDSMVTNARNILRVTEIYRQYVEVAKIIRQSFLLRSDDDCNKVKVLLKSSVYQQDLSMLSESSQAFFHLSLYYLYKLQAEYEKSYEAVWKAWEMMNQGSIDFSSRRPQEYLICFTAYLAACLDAKKLTQSKKWLEIYRKWLNEKYPGSLVVNGRFYCLYLAHHYLEDGDTIKTSVLKEAEDFFLKNNTLLDDDVRRGLKYLLMIVFFRRKEFSTAWDYCQLILNGSATAPRRELYDTTRLVFLLVLYESDKFSELDYYCRQLSGFIRKKDKKEYLLERIVIKHFTKMAIEIPSRDNDLVILKKLNNDLEQLSKSDNICAKQLLHQFDFGAWVNRKMAELSKT